MKIMIVGDVHWSQYSSILRRRGEKYSYRLENLIKSVDWAENLSYESKCDFIVYLGDFFDSAEINSEELSALKEISWSNKQHYFLVGNHEAGRGNLLYNSADIFNLANFEVINKPKPYYKEDIKFIFIPYILEKDRKELKEYIPNETEFDKTCVKQTIIFSHNDIKGFSMGNFISQEGFDIVDIDKNCDLYLNGHLHNGGRVSERIINVGNLTGQNFSEDAFKYDHSVIVLDTDNNQCAVYKNPHALNFYKLDFTIKNDIDYINDISLKMGHNCVATIKCFEEDLDYLRKRFDPNCKDDLIPSNCNMVESRFIVQSKIQKHVKDKEEIISINHLDQFKEYMINLYGNSDILMKELQEVCK